MNCYNLFILIDRLYKHYSKLKLSSFYCYFEAKTFCLINALSNDFFSINGIAKLVSGAAKKAKKRQYIWNRVLDKDKASKTTDGDTLSTVKNKELSSTIGEKRLLPEIADIEPILPAIRNKKLSPKTTNAKLILLAIRDKKLPSDIVDTKPLLLARNKKLLLTVNRTPISADASSARVNNKGLLKIVNKSLLVTVANKAPALVEKVTYARVIFFYWHFQALSAFFFARSAFKSL